MDDVVINNGAFSALIENSALKHLKILPKMSKVSKYA